MLMDASGDRRRRHKRLGSYGIGPKRSGISSRRTRPCRRIPAPAVFPGQARIVGVHTGDGPITNGHVPARRDIEVLRDARGTCDNSGQCLGSGESRGGAARATSEEVPAT